MGVTTLPLIPSRRGRGNDLLDSLPQSSPSKEKEFWNDHRIGRILDQLRGIAMIRVVIVRAMGDDQVRVDLQLDTQPVAIGAHAEGGVEAE